MGSRPVCMAPREGPHTGAGGGGGSGKFTTWEGGHRVMGLVNWPGKISPGVSHSLTSALDILPTVLGLAGVAPPEGIILDGYDLGGLLFDAQPGKHLRTRHFFFFQHVLCLLILFLEAATSFIFSTSLFIYFYFCFCTLALFWGVRGGRTDLFSPMGLCVFPYSHFFLFFLSLLFPAMVGLPYKCPPRERSQTVLSLFCVYQGLANTCF